MTDLRLRWQSTLQRALLPLMMLMPVACSLLPTTDTAIDSSQPAQWQQIRDQLEQLSQWRLVARLGVQTRDQGGSLDLYWQQNGDTFNIRLIAPLGQGAISLSGNPQQVSARLANGRQVQGRPDTLMQQHFDVAVPVSALPYWLRGLPAPDAGMEAVGWNEHQRLQRFVQSGWKVEMRDYKTVGDYLLPHRFYLEPVGSASDADGGDTSVRLVVRQWVL